MGGPREREREREREGERDREAGGPHPLENHKGLYVPLGALRYGPLEKQVEPLGRVICMVLCEIR